MLRVRGYSPLAGASFDLSDSLDLDIGYRFRSVMSDGSDPMEHQVLTGLRYKF